MLAQLNPAIGFPPIMHPSPTRSAAKVPGGSKLSLRGTRPGWRQIAYTFAFTIAFAIAFAIALAFATTLPFASIAIVVAIPARRAMF